MKIFEEESINIMVALFENEMSQNFCVCMPCSTQTTFYFQFHDKTFVLFKTFHKYIHMVCTYNQIISDSTTNSTCTYVHVHIQRMHPKLDRLNIHFITNVDLNLHREFS